MYSRRPSQSICGGLFVISPIQGRLINKTIYVGVNPYVGLLNPYRGCIISVLDIRIPMTRKTLGGLSQLAKGVSKQIMHEKGTNFNFDLRSSILGLEFGVKIRGDEAGAVFDDVGELAMADYAGIWILLG